MRTTALPLAALALALAACVGAIGETTGARDGAGDGDGDGEGGGFDGTDPGDPRLEARVWRLSPDQYNGEVQRMFPGAPVVNLPEGASEQGIVNVASTARIDLGNASQFTDAARTIGAWVSSQGAEAARCEAFGTEECLDTFLSWFPEAAFRRPPTDEQLAELRSVHEDVEPTYGPDWAFSAVVRAVLLHPQFLYRYEIGPEGEGVVEIDDWEIASLMSFSLTNAGPDEELRADAAAGRLRDPEVREEHARRLMPTSADVWQRFFWEWLKMSTLESQGNEVELDPALVADLEAEYRAYVENIVVTERSNLTALLTTSHTWTTPAVAEYYGASHPGDGVERVELDPDQRGGLLTLGAWLVAHGKRGRDNVVRRGMAVFRDAMCNSVVPLDIDLEAALDELVGPDASVKEIADARSADPTCGACHSTSDPVGLSFESYAGDGTWQTEYADGRPVESSVVWNGEPYATAPELSAALAEDESFQHCLVQRFGHFLLGADFGAPVQVRAAREAHDAFVAADGNFEELLVAIVRDPAFIERRK